MDWSEKNLCIKCNEGGNLLVCSESGCPLAVHDGCMGCPVRFDDAGKFYCPYCWYKKAVIESRWAREYALEKKKALMVFLGDDVEGSKGKKSLLKTSRMRKLGDTEEKIVGEEDECPSLEIRQKGM